MDPEGYLSLCVETRVVEPTPYVFLAQRISEVDNNLTVWQVKLELANSWGVSEGASYLVFVRLRHQFGQLEGSNDFFHIFLDSDT